MKNFLFFICMSFSYFASAHVSTKDVTDLPTNVCYQGCTDYMKTLLAEFENQGVLPSSIPTVYSGDCHHLSDNYDPDYTHHAVVLLDQKKQVWNFSTIFSYFYDSDEFINWNLETARQEMSSYWNDHGDIKTGSNAARVEVNFENGQTAYVYWMRQNPKTKDLLYITASYAQVSFCRLKAHSE